MCFVVKPVIERKLLMVSIIFSLLPLYALSGLSVVFLFKKRSVDQKVNGSIPNLKFELVNESLVVKTLQGLKASKASGLDNISRVC